MGVTSSDPSFLQCETGETTEKTALPLPDRRTAVRRVREYLQTNGLTLDWIGHRFVHVSSQAMSGFVPGDGPSGHLGQDPLQKPRDEFPHLLSVRALQQLGPVLVAREQLEFGLATGQLLQLSRAVRARVILGRDEQ